MDIITYKLAQKYADQVAAGFSSVTVDGMKIIFTLNDGKTATVTVPAPKDGEDGISITNVTLNNQSHLICTLSDSSTIDAGLIRQGVDGNGITSIEKTKTEGLVDTYTIYFTNGTTTTFTVTNGSGGGGTDDYTDLTNKPTINNVELNGNKTSSDLGLQPAGNYVTNTDYATPNVGGVIKVANGDYGLTVDEGALKGTVRTVSQYENMSSKGLICKGTLENVLEDKGYQEELISGTNIKTINNISVLGSGNIDIQGGEGSSDLIVSDSIGDNALEFSDEQGHIVMLVDNQGTIKTKTFNSSSATDTPSQLTDMIYELHRRTAANTTYPAFAIKGNVLVIGDSTIAGTGVGTKISALMSLASGYTLTDISQGGDTIQGQTSKYNNLSSSVKAAINYAVIQIGLNDVYPASATLSDLKTKYQTLINAIKTNSPNAYIVISCMLPCRARWQALVPTTADHAQQMWAELNQSIINNEYGADAVASIHQWALAYDNFVLRPEYDTGDKIHENKAGQQVILLSWLSAMFNNNSLSKGGNN